ncbi:Major facilitator superfamily [Dillenia turbinata]|uniref:Major facilitator superfamily n=1 Tax=Dillenia turbinata TaxID=194707 RepID=A0AAN8Z4W4_9MAGN
MGFKTTRPPPIRRFQPQIGFPRFLGTMRTRTFFGVSLSIILINLAAVMERADENLLPSVYKEVSEAFNVGPSDLGYLTFIRNFVQGLASPMAGVLSIQYDRPTVLAMGTACWALSTAAVGVSQHFLQVAFWRAINGFGLAIVIPSLQSFVADSYKDDVRGAGFGVVNLIGTFGGIGGGALATVMADRFYGGMPGWRVAFITMAAVSLLIGLLVFLFVVDPRRKMSSSRDAVENSDRDDLIDKGVFFTAYPPASASIWAESWEAMKAVVKIQTFQIIVLQGVVGSLPWTAMVFFTMWFELMGFDHNTTAVLIGLFAVGCATGSLVGGIIADHMSRIYPHSGRIICAQFSAIMGVPFSLVLLRVIPQSVSSWHAYAITLFLMGLAISWIGTAVNAPIFAEVVPVKHRTMIYAFDRAFEGSFSSFAAPIVGLLAEDIFGYDPKSVIPGSSSPREALALSKGLLSMMTVPFALCSLFYTPLYTVFGRDRENVRLASLKEAEM